MTFYILIDGDDIGNKIAKGYIENDEEKLVKTIQELTSILTQICDYLKLVGFEVIYNAADGVLCKGSGLDIDAFAQYAKNVGKPNYTFSVGIGDDLQSAFFALKYAKAVGKDKVAIYEAGASFKILG